MVTAGGPYYSRLADMDFDEARRAIQEHPMLMVGCGQALHGQGPARAAGWCSWAAPAAAIPPSASG